MYFTRLFIASATLLAATSGFAQQPLNYRISGRIPGATEILLSKDVYGSVILDSAKNSDGSFSFRGTVPDISLGALIVKNKQRQFPDYYHLFIENGQINVQLYPGGRQISARGSKNNDIMTQVESRSRDFYTIVSPLYDSINLASMKIADLRQAEVVDKDSVQFYLNQQARLEKTATPYIEKRNKVLQEAFNKYPDTYFTAYYAIGSARLPEAELKAIYARFGADIKNSAVGKDWEKMLTAAQQLQPGTPAPNFSVTDIDGKTIALSDYKGKYVLLDFWATWCGPCRAGNPHLIELYNAFKDKGIEFIGVADDDTNVNGWKKAVKDDGIGIWPQVLRNRKTLDKNGQPADIAKAYLVGSYPTKILIDKEGRILHQFAPEENMEAIFQEVLGK